MGKNQHVTKIFRPTKEYRRQLKKVEPDQYGTYSGRRVGGVKIILYTSFYSLVRRRIYFGKIYRLKIHRLPETEKNEQRIIKN